MIDRLQIFTKVFDFTVWMLNHTIKFPKSHRFTIAVRIEDVLLDILQGIIIANMRKDKLADLQKVNEHLEVLRILLRLSHSLRFFATNSYEYAVREINEIGRLLGGWIKQQVQSAQKGDRS